MYIRGYHSSGLLLLQGMVMVLTYSLYTQGVGGQLSMCMAIDCANIQHAYSFDILYASERVCPDAIFARTISPLWAYIAIQPGTYRTVGYISCAWDWVWI